jgi:hypothetical protein
MIKNMKPCLLKRLGRVAVAFALLQAGLLCVSAVSPDGSRSTNETATMNNAATADKQEAQGKMDSHKDIWDIAASVGTVAAAVFAWLATRQTKFATLQTQQATERTEQAARAQRLVDLWPDMEGLTFLTPAQIQTLDNDVAQIVRATANRMEKIAFLWESDLVDRDKLLAEVNGDDNYIKLYEQIKGLGRIKRFELNGEELLAENPAAKRFYEHLVALKSKPSLKP